MTPIEHDILLFLIGVMTGGAMIALGLWFVIHGEDARPG